MSAQRWSWGDSYRLTLTMAVSWTALWLASLWGDWVIGVFLGTLLAVGAVLVIVGLHRRRLGPEERARRLLSTPGIEMQNGGQYATRHPHLESEERRP